MVTTSLEVLGIVLIAVALTVGVWPWLPAVGVAAAGVWLIAVSAFISRRRA